MLRNKDKGALAKTGATDCKKRLDGPDFVRTNKPGGSQHGTRWVTGPPRLAGSSCVHRHTSWHAPGQDATSFGHLPDNADVAHSIEHGIVHSLA